MTPFKLFGRVDRAANTDERDTLQTKAALKKLGYYTTPSYGITPYPDEHMFDGIKAYQRNFGLNVDGVMAKGGETEQSLKQNLAAASYGFKCTRCGVIHGGVYSRTLCADCYKQLNS